MLIPVALSMVLIVETGWILFSLLRTPKNRDTLKMGMFATK